MSHRARSHSLLLPWLLAAVGPSLAADPATAASCTTPDDLPACVADLTSRDPAAALRIGEPAWQASVAAAPDVALGLVLVDAASAAGRRDAVIEIGSALRTGAHLTPEQTLRLLKKLNGAIGQARDAARIAELETETARLETRLGGEQDLAELWRQLAASYYNMGAQDDALRVARIALLKVPTHPHLVEYNANQIVFIISAQQGRMPEAIEALLEVERVGKALNRPADPALLQNATGVFVYAQDWPKAIEYGRRALAAYDAKPRPGLPRAEILSNLGSAYEGATRLGQAEALYRQALDSARAEGASPVAALNNLANVLRRLNRPREALPLLREAADAIEGAGDNGDAAIVYSNIGAAHADLGEHEAAAVAFERSRALFAQSDNVPRRLELYPRMIDTLDVLGRHREALALMREYKALNDASVNVESRTRIAELESAIGLARKESELAAVERARADEQVAFAALQTSEQRQRSIVYGLLAALLALGTFVVLKLREGRRRRQANAELARKNVEIEAQHRELELLNAAIRRQSEEDALTGLRNRRYVQTWLDTRVAAQTQGQVQAPMLVALLDLDHFKRVNDLHGHEGGDHALMHLGDILCDCGRTGDVIARWGGEEFLWICPGSTLADAPALFRRLRERLQAEPLVRPTGTVVLSVSMGASLFPAHPSRSGDWPLSLRIADAALYRAKHEGRGRWVGYAVAGDGPLLADDELDLAVDLLETRGRLRLVGDVAPMTV
ncbi:tetratricopeptide repeat-containing diguanylate cyclase [Luteimonas sp. TWI1416]|uniref:tetratricopeptide repeat-containing diguanylate cyclase n=1 Tax=unclassified Luteimonas TaxID=2629088 RepID=UPI003207DEA7